MAPIQVKGYKSAIYLFFGKSSQKTHMTGRELVEEVSLVVEYQPAYLPRQSEAAVADCSGNVPRPTVRVERPQSQVASALGTHLQERVAPARHQEATVTSASADDGSRSHTSVNSSLTSVSITYQDRDEDSGQSQMSTDYWTDLGVVDHRGAQRDIVHEGTQFIRTEPWKSPKLCWKLRTGFEKRNTPKRLGTFRSYLVSTILCYGQR